MTDTTIHLCVHGGPPVLGLVIPFNDIGRLSLRPLKWLRYVTFALCGVRGDLSETPGGDTMTLYLFRTLLPNTIIILLMVHVFPPIRPDPKP